MDNNIVTKGDLGAIDEEYDVAVSTACGPLDNIVVDCIDTGQHCVELLTKHDVGVATFIGLDKMQKWKEISRKKIATYVYRLCLAELSLFGFISDFPTSQFLQLEFP